MYNTQDRQKTQNKNKYRIKNKEKNIRPLNEDGYIDAMEYIQKKHSFKENL